jgi:hypothetical protein
VQEELIRCRSGALTHNGSRSSSMKLIDLSISKTERTLMFQEQRMLKDNQLLFMVKPMDLTRNGRLSILIKLRKIERRDSTKTSVSTLKEISMFNLLWVQEDIST